MLFVLRIYTYILLNFIEHKQPTQPVSSRAPYRLLIPKINLSDINVVVPEIPEIAVPEIPEIPTEPLDPKTLSEELERIREEIEEGEIPGAVGDNHAIIKPLLPDNSELNTPELARSATKALT
jgi:hypothetical protein